MRWFNPGMNDGRTVFVFGSNLAGRHGAGAARGAREYWGARTGVGKGLQGSAYAIPTKNERLETLPVGEIQQHVKEFLDFARQRPELRFLITPVGCGLAGLTTEVMAPMFAEAPANCEFAEDFFNQTP